MDENGKARKDPPRYPPPNRRLMPFKFGQVPNWLVLLSMGFAMFSIVSTTFKNR